MERLGLNSEYEYYERLRGVSRIVEAELRNLLNLVTITETCFFRDAAQFRLLREHIIPTLMAGQNQSSTPNRHLRIWSAGCSSGDEAYSIAMTLDEMGLFRAQPDLVVEIVGTDLNTDALEKARRGTYSERAVRNVEGRMLDRYFRREHTTYQLRDEIRNRVRFEFGNLTQTRMPSTGCQDVVFCKNVAIYFRSDVTQEVVRGIHDAISAGGFLLLGHSESLWQMSEGFDLVEYEGAFCYRKVTGLQVPAAALTAPGSELGSSPCESDPAIQYRACLALFRASDWASAESCLAGLIRSCPTFVPAFLLLGGVYVHRARYDEAVEQAEAALRLTGLEPRAHLLLGMIASRGGRTEDARRSLERALYLDDSLALAHFWLGNLYRDRGDRAGACAEYQDVVRGWERHTLKFTEEFALDLTAEELVKFCSDSADRLGQDD